MAFHLLYFKPRIQLKARLDKLICRLNKGDLGDLSSNSCMMELSHTMSKMLKGGSGGGGEKKERVESTLAPKREGMEGVL
ncbi:hypothetical protein ACSBR2_039051 [Camellia fascicularis]